MVAVDPSYCLVTLTLIGEDKPAFLFTVGYRDKNGKFSTVIEKGCVDNSWHRANRINKFNKTVDLLYSTSATNDMSLMKHLNDEVEDFFEEGKYILYLRVNCEYKLEYRLGTSKDVPDDHEDINEQMMLELVEWLKTRAWLSFRKGGLVYGWYW